MPTPLHRVARRALNILGPVIVVLLFVLAVLQAQRTADTVRTLRDFIREQRTAQVNGCHRGNQLRAQVNANVDVLGEFIGEAIRARRTSGDIAVADRYSALLPKLNPLELVNCEQAFPKAPA